MLRPWEGGQRVSHSLGASRGGAPRLGSTPGGAGLPDRRGESTARGGARAFGGRGRASPPAHRPATQLGLGSARRGTAGAVEARPGLDWSAAGDPGREPGACGAG